eukprot:2468537-Rhodomonas_salina.1
MYSAFVGERFSAHRISKRHYTHSPGWRLFFLPLTPLQERRAAAWLQAERGARYDYTGALLTVFPRKRTAPAHATTTITTSAHSSTNLYYYRTLFCSEAVLALLQHIGMAATHLDPRQCSPALLYMMLAQHTLPK